MEDDNAEAIVTSSAPIVQPCGITYPKPNPLLGSSLGFTIVIHRVMSYGRPLAAGHVGKSVRVATMSDGSTIG